LAGVSAIKQFNITLIFFDTDKLAHKIKQSQFQAMSLAGCN